MFFTRGVYLWLFRPTCVYYHHQVLNRFSNCLPTKYFNVSTTLMSKVTLVTMLDAHEWRNGMKKDLWHRIATSFTVVPMLNYLLFVPQLNRIHRLCTMTCLNAPMLMSKSCAHQIHKYRISPRHIFEATNCCTLDVVVNNTWHGCKWLRH